MLHLRLDKSPAEDDNYNPLVSVLVPAYNEQLTLRNSIQSILNQTYQNLEIIIIDDGSTDHTNSIAKDIENKFERVSVVTKGNGGKSSALNFGVISSSGEIVVCVDADTVLHPEAIANMTKCFSDTSIAAVSGNVKVANRKNFWGITQSLEYVNSLALQRRAFA